MQCLIKLNATPAAGVQQTGGCKVQDRPKGPHTRPCTNRHRQACHVALSLSVAQTAKPLNLGQKSISISSIAAQLLYNRNVHSSACTLPSLHGTLPTTDASFQELHPQLPNLRVTAPATIRSLIFHKARILAAHTLKVLTHQSPLTYPLHTVSGSLKTLFGFKPLFPCHHNNERLLANKIPPVCVAVLFPAGGQWSSSCSLKRTLCSWESRPPITKLLTSPTLSRLQRCATGVACVQPSKTMTPDGLAATVVQCTHQAKDSERSNQHCCAPCYAGAQQPKAG